MKGKLCISRAKIVCLLFISGCASTQSTALNPSVISHQVHPLGLPQGVLTHVIRPGETLWSIGKNYSIPYQAIMKANGLKDASSVPAGSRLIIPSPKPPKSVVPVYANPRWTHIVVHHSAMKKGNAKIIDRSHKKKGFKNGLGYHFVIDNGTSNRRDGQIEVGSRWKRQINGAHCNANGMNQHGIGVCLIGDFTHRKPSEYQMQALVDLVHQLRTYYRIPTNRIISHRDVPGKNTACPGDSFPWAEFKSRLTKAIQY